MSSNIRCNFKKMSVECVIQNAAKTVGEGPHWDDVTNTLLYVDIYVNAIHRYDPDSGKDERIVLGTYWLIRNLIICN